MSSRITSCSRAAVWSKPAIKLIDFGARRTCAPANYSKDETVFDPVYGPPEKYPTPGR